MASTHAVQFADAVAVTQATDWARRLSSQFSRVALFCIDGTAAHLVAAFGMQPRHAHPSLSLVAQTPLRWCLEAAVPFVGAGRGPGGGSLANHLGVPAPRAFAVVPFMLEAKLVALAYVDCGQAPLPMRHLAALMRDMSAAEDTPASPHYHGRIRDRRRARRPLGWHGGATRHGGAGTDAAQPSAPNDSRLSRVASAPRAVHNDDARRAAPSAVPSAAPPALLHHALDTVRQTERNVSSPGLPWPDVPTNPIFDREPLATPEDAGTLCREPARPRRIRWRLASKALFGAGLLLLVLACILPLLPPTRIAGAPATVQIDVSAHTRLTAMAHLLAQQQLIRQPQLFIVLARLFKVDRHLRAGTYQIPTGLWPWQVLDILHRGQVQIVRITIPEGLTLRETAQLLAKQGLSNELDFMRAAQDPALLRRYEIAASSAEGFLFPETYRVVRGVSARDLVAAMIRQFFHRIAAIPHPPLSNQELYDRVILASLVERETRDKQELARVAGVFNNRLSHNMRLESCASIQYVLGHPKEHLQLEDIRIPSPYNTYVHPGLPPGPIANPGAAALAAALQPETHDYFFFFALADGSHRHHFSKSFAEHQKAHAALGYHETADRRR